MHKYYRGWGGFDLPQYYSHLKSIPYETRLTEESYGDPNRYGLFVRVRVLDATFNNISVLLVEDTRENHRPVASRWQTLSNNVVSSTSRLSGVRTLNVSGIGTGSIGSHKSNFHSPTGLLDKIFGFKEIIIVVL